MLSELSSPSVQTLPDVYLSSWCPCEKLWSFGLLVLTSSKLYRQIGIHSHSGKLFRKY